MLIIVKKTGSESHFLAALQPRSETWPSKVCGRWCATVLSLCSLFIYKILLSND